VTWDEIRLDRYEAMLFIKAVEREYLLHDVVQSITGLHCNLRLSDFACREGVITFRLNLLLNGEQQLDTVLARINALGGVKAGRDRRPLGGSPPPASATQLPQTPQTKDPIPVTLEQPPTE
jgi:(p)ppGpp synthase/HD superfamily hydrolase